MSNAKKAKLSKHEPSFTCDCLVCVTHVKKMVYDMDNMDNEFHVTCEKGKFECWRHDRFMFDLLCKSPVCPAFCVKSGAKIVPSVRKLTDLEVVYASLPKLVIAEEEVVVMYASPVDEYILPYRRVDDHVSEVLGMQGMTWLNSDLKLLAGGRKKIKKEQLEQDAKPLVYRGPKALPDNFIVTLKGRYGPTLRMPYPERPWTFNHLSMTNVDNLCLDYFAHMSALYVNYCVRWSRVSFNLSCDTDRVASMFLGLVGEKVDVSKNPSKIVMSRDIHYQAFPVNNFVEGKVYSTAFFSKGDGLKVDDYRVHDGRKSRKELFWIYGFSVEGRPQPILDASLVCNLEYKIEFYNLRTIPLIREFPNSGKLAIYQAQCNEGKTHADKLSHQKDRRDYDLEKHRKTFKPLSDDRDARAAELEKILKDRDKKRYEPELDTISQSYTRPQVSSVNPLEGKEVKDRDKKRYEPELDTTSQFYTRPQVNSSNPLETKEGEWEGGEEVDESSKHGSDESTASSSDWEEVESLDPRYAPAPWV